MMKCAFTLSFFCIFFLLSVFICVYLWFQSSSVALCAEAGEDCQGCFLGALASLAYGADARRASVFAGT